MAPANNININQVPLTIPADSIGLPGNTPLPKSKSVYIQDVINYLRSVGITREEDMFPYISEAMHVHYLKYGPSEF